MIKVLGINTQPCMQSVQPSNFDLICIVLIAARVKCQWGGVKHRLPNNAPPPFRYIIINIMPKQSETRVTC